MAVKQISASQFIFWPNFQLLKPSCSSSLKTLGKTEYFHKANNTYNTKNVKPFPSGNLDFTNSKAWSTLSCLVKSSSKECSLPEPFALSCWRPASVKHPANTWHPRLSRRRASAWPNPESHPVTIIYLSAYLPTVSERIKWSNNL